MKDQIPDDRGVIKSKDGGAVHKVDRDILKSAQTGEGLIKIESAKQFREMAEAAVETLNLFQKKMKSVLTPERCKRVRELRVVEGYSWRAVAAQCNDEFEGDWESNQLAGMALCEYAAKSFDEDYMKPPWNG